MNRSLTLLSLTLGASLAHADRIRPMQGAQVFDGLEFRAAKLCEEIFRLADGETRCETVSYQIHPGHTPATLGNIVKQVIYAHNEGYVESATATAIAAPAEVEQLADAMDLVVQAPYFDETETVPQAVTSAEDAVLENLDTEAGLTDANGQALRLFVKGTADQGCGFHDAYLAVYAVDTGELMILSAGVSE